MGRIKKFSFKFRIVLFGSMVRNSDFDVASDIDIAVEELAENYLKAYAEEQISYRL